MKTYAETFPNNKKDGEDRYGWFSAGSYKDITNQIGTAVIEVSDSDYQGDTRILFERENEFGWLQFGWGSCSGCDALEGCDTPAQWESLANALEQQTKWLPKAEMLAFFKSHDWAGDYSWGREEQDRFVKQAIEYMEKAITP